MKYAWILRVWKLKHVLCYLISVSQCSSYQRCSMKKGVFRNSQEYTCARVSFLIKLQSWNLELYLKRLWHRCLPVNFAKFLRTPFSLNTSGGCFCLLKWQEVKMNSALNYIFQVNNNGVSERSSIWSGMHDRFVNTSVKNNIIPYYPLFRTSPDRFM